MGAKANQLRSVRNGQIAEHQTIEQRERCRVRPDPERERENGDGGEAGGFPQHARAKAQVLQQYFHDARSQHVSAFFFKFLVGAEFDARAALRFRARQAGALEVVRAILHVCPQLFVCFVLHVPTAK